MEVLAIINKILGLKIVQWALLVFSVAASLVMTFQALNLKLSHIQITSLEADNNKKDGITIKQNANIAVWEAEGKRAKERVQEASEAAARIAGVYEKKIQILKTQPIREDCCGAIEDAKNIILGVGQ